MGAMTGLGRHLKHLVVKDHTLHNVDVLCWSSANCRGLLVLKWQSFKYDCETLEAILSQGGKFLYSLDLRRVSSERLMRILAATSLLELQSMN